MAKVLKINKNIINALPTDGLWDDGRTDEDQLRGLSYEDLEKAMNLEKHGNDSNEFNQKELELLKVYKEIRTPNLHKMNEIPIFKLRK